MTGRDTSSRWISRILGPVHRFPRKISWAVSVVTVAGMLDDARSLLADLLTGDNPFLAFLRLIILLGLGGTGLAFAFRPRWAPVPFAFLIAAAIWNPEATNLHLVILLLLVCAAMLLDWLRLLSMALPYLMLRAFTHTATDSFWNAVPGIILGVGLGRIVWLVITHKEQSERENRELMRAAQEREEAAALHAELMERRFTAQRLELMRELHDVVAHELTRITMKATLAQGMSTEETSSIAFGEIADGARGALGEMRRLVSIIGEDDFGQRRQSAPPFPEAKIEERIANTKEYLEEVGFRVKVTQDLKDEVTGSLLSAASAVIREASTNVAKHGAPASECHITVSARDKLLRVEIQNHIADPTTDQLIPRSGLGLDLLRARVEALGGQLKACRAGDVWTLSATWEQ